MRIVLLPGMDGTGELFAPFLSSAPSNWSPDVISYPRKEKLGYDACTALVRPRLPRGESYILLGESFSGPVSIRLAAEKPPDLVALVLCNTFARRPWWPIFSVLSRPSFFRRPLPSFIMARMGAGKDNPNLRSLLRSATGSVLPEVLAHRLRELLTVDVTHCLREVAVPVLFLHGSRDTTIRPWALRHVRSVRPDIVVRELPVAHLLLQLAPESAWAAIDSFVAKRVAA